MPLPSASGCCAPKSDGEDGCTLQRCLPSLAWYAERPAVETTYTSWEATGGGVTAVFPGEEDPPQPASRSQARKRKRVPVCFIGFVPMITSCSFSMYLQ